MWWIIENHRNPGRPYVVCSFESFAEANQYVVERDPTILRVKARDSYYYIRNGNFILFYNYALRRLSIHFKPSDKEHFYGKSLIFEIVKLNKDISYLLGLD